MKELHLRNHQRDKAIRANLLRQIVFTLLDEELELHNYELAIHLIPAAKMAQLNEQFLQHQGSTDVITFDYSEGYTAAPQARAEASTPALSGEIYISVADAMIQAREFSTTWQEEVVRYAIHGVLHLRGYDDLVPAKRRVMKVEENRLLRRLAKRFDISKLAR
jgi:rRNA maturation RNase YbeY